VRAPLLAVGIALDHIHMVAAAKAESGPDFPFAPLGKPLGLG
jgi:hypothetical protein